MSSARLFPAQRGGEDLRQARGARVDEQRHRHGERAITLVGRQSSSGPRRAIRGSPACPSRRTVAPRPTPSASSPCSGVADVDDQPVWRPAFASGADLRRKLVDRATAESGDADVADAVALQATFDVDRRRRLARQLDRPGALRCCRREARSASPSNPERRRAGAVLRTPTCRASAANRARGRNRPAGCPPWRLESRRASRPLADST